MKPILVIYWAPSNLGILQNILFELGQEGQEIDKIQLKYLREKGEYWKKKAPQNSSFLSILYLLFQIIKINYRMFFYRRVYIFGTNAVIFALPQIILNRNKVIAHCNELPKFLDSKIFIFSRLEKFTLKRINWLIVSNKERLALFRPYISADAGTFILENVLQYHHYKTENPNKVLKTRKRDRFKFIYAGLIAKNRDINLLIDFFKDHEKIELNLVGPIDPNYEDEFFASTKGTSNIKWHGVVGFDQTQQYILDSDFGVALYTLSNMNNKYCAPVKIHEYIYQRVPILVYHNPTLKELVDDYRIAFAIEDLQPDKNFGDKVTGFYNQLDNQKFIDFERTSYSDFLAEFKRLKETALS